jgi:hypothetical protein
MSGGALEFVLRCLRIAGDPSEEDWGRILEFSERTQLTLLLRNASGLPAWVGAAIETRSAKNARRLACLRETYGEISLAFGLRGIEFVFLKGLSHEPLGFSPLDRVQYDVDLFCDPDSIAEATKALRALGYAPHSDLSVSDQHLPPFVKPHQWRWRNDYFDPDMPIPVELHTTLWNGEEDRIRLSGPNLFWRRRLRDVHWLHVPDRIAYAALHALRHILRNDARPAHVFELACFLEGYAHDSDFWREWRGLHDRRLRQLQAVAFRFASEWFQCELPGFAAADIAELGPQVSAWFDEFAWSPASNLLQPNKHVLWLHLALAESLADRAVILRRRLFPIHSSRTHGASSASRLGHHASTIAPVLASGFRWWRRCAAA